MAQRLNMIVDRVLAGLLGDAEHSEPARPALMIDQLSDWLPYRVSDPSNRLYLNARSKGFVLSVTPLIGADERTGEILGQFFSEGLPPGACLQVLHLASPRISRIIAPWFAPRYLQGGVYEAIARHRARRLYGLVWQSGSADAPFHARHHQVIVSVGVPAAKAVSNEELRQTRDSLIAMLKSLNLGVVEVGPEALIAIIDDLTAPTTAPQEDALAASKALRPRVAALIAGMVDAIREDTPITEAQKELLQVASIPLYKILTVQAAYGRGMPTDDRETLAEIASVDLLFAVLDRIVSESGRSMSSFIGADEAKIAMWQGQVNVVRQALADRQANTHLKVGAIMQIIEKTAFIENVLAASMSPGMSASLDWSRGVQSRALSQ